MRIAYHWVGMVTATKTAGNRCAGDSIRNEYHNSYTDCVASLRAHPPAPDEEAQIALLAIDDFGRSWAYVEDGRLHTHFRNTLQNPTSRVPEQFHVELRDARQKEETQ